MLILRAALGDTLPALPISKLLLTELDLMLPFFKGETLSILNCCIVEVFSALSLNFELMHCYFNINTYFRGDANAFID